MEGEPGSRTSCHLPPSTPDRRMEGLRCCRRAPCQEQHQTRTVEAMGKEPSSGIDAFCLHQPDRAGTRFGSSPHTQSSSCPTETYSDWKWGYLRETHQVSFPPSTESLPYRKSNVPCTILENAHRYTKRIVQKAIFCTNKIRNFHIGEGDCAYRTFQ